MAACACLMAQGDLERLGPAVKTALDNGVTINELKEAFSQLYAYTGFPRSLNALGVFAGDQLTAANREIVTVAALSGLEGVAPQLAAHKQGAVNMGNAQKTVDELCAWLDSEGFTLRSKWPWLVSGMGQGPCRAEARRDDCHT